MKKLLLIFGFIFFLNGAFAQTPKSVKINDLLLEINKNDDTLRVVNLWATWCAPCVKELPYFEQVKQEFKTQKIKIILVGIEDDLSKITAFAQKKKLQSNVWYLNEPSANDWIPQIQKDWQGDIPVTLFARKGKSEFHSGDFTKAELSSKIENFLK